MGENAKDPRFVSVVDTKREALGEVAAAFRARGIEVVEELDVLNTLVLAGPLAAVRRAASEIAAVSSLEEERTVGPR